MVIKLKHGKLDVNLLLCSLAQKAAGVSFEMEHGKMSMGVMGLASFGYHYIFHSYRCYCDKNRIEQEWDKWDFDEELSRRDVPEKESNLPEVMEQVTNTLVSTLQKELEKLEDAKGEKKTNSKSGMDLKPISVAS